MSGLTQKQLAIRRTRIGGSEIGALLGIDPHKGAFDVFLDKTLPAPDQPQAHQEWGSTVEWSIIEYHARVEGLTIERPGTLIHPDFPFICATPDGIGVPPAAIGRQLPGDARVIEAKNVGRWMAGGWGEEEGEDAPFHYLAQVHWNVGVALRLGLAGEIGNLVPAIAGEAPRKYVVRFDPELYAGLVEVAAKFARDHLQTGIPPDGASVDDTATYIKRRYATPTENLLEPTPELTDLWNEVVRAREAHGAAEEAKVAAENRMKAALGEFAGIAGLCTWKLQAGSTFQVTKEPSRVLRKWPAPKKSKKNANAKEG